MLLKRLQNLIGEGPAALPAQWLWLAPMLVFIKFAGSIGRGPQAVANSTSVQPEDNDAGAEHIAGDDVADASTLIDEDEDAESILANELQRDSVAPANLLADLEEISNSGDEPEAGPVDLSEPGGDGGDASQGKIINVGGISIFVPADPSTVPSALHVAAVFSQPASADPAPDDTGNAPAANGSAPDAQDASDGSFIGSAGLVLVSGDNGSTPGPPVAVNAPKLPSGISFLVLENNSPTAIGSTPIILGSEPVAVGGGFRLIDDREGLFGIDIENEKMVLFTTGPLGEDDFPSNSSDSTSGDGFRSMDLEFVAFDEFGDGPVQTVHLILELNVAPTAVITSSDNVTENIAIGTTVATLDAIDSNSGGTFTFELLDDANGTFILGGIAGNELLVAARIDVEIATRIVVTVRVTDQAGGFVDTDIVINVNDINESRPEIEFDAFFQISSDDPAGEFGIVNVSDDDVHKIVTGVRLVDDFGGLFSAALENGDVVLSVSQSLDPNNLPVGVTTSLDPNGRPSIRLELIVFDEVGDGNTAVVFVTPTSAPEVNEAPVANDDTGTITELPVANDDTPNNIAGNVLTGAPNADEADSDANAADVLNVTEVNGNAGNVGVSVAGLYGTLTINADGSYSYELDDSNAVVNALTAADRLTDSFTYTASDGSGGSDTATLTITVNGINDGPRIDLDTLDRRDVDATSVFKAVQENSGKTAAMLITDLVAGTPVGSFVSISDPDSTEISQMTFALQLGTFEVGLDELFMLALNNVTVLGLGDTVVGNIEILSLSATTIVLGGTDTIANYEIALERVGLDHIGDNPDTAMLRLMNVTAEDVFGQLSNVAVAMIRVDANNDAPVITSVDTASAKEDSDGAPSSGTVHTVTASDPDTADTVTFSITGGADRDLFSINAMTGEVTFSTPGTVVPEFSNPVDANGDGAYELIVTATDSEGLTDSQLIVVTVTPHDGPTNLALSNDAVSEDASPGATVGVLSALDPDGVDTLSYSIVADPSGAFQIGGDDGNELQITGALDAESTLMHTVTVRVTDDGGIFTERQFQINVLDVNESRPDVEPLAPIEVTVDDTIGPLGIIDISDADVSKVVTGVRLADDFAGLFSVSLDNGDAILSLQRAIDFDALPTDVFSILNPDGTRSVDLQLTAFDSLGDGLTETVRVTVDGSFTLWDHVIESLVLDGSNLELIGHDWDNTLIRNVTIRNFDGNGILLQDVDNVRLENVTVEDVTGAGVVYENVSNVHFDEGLIDNTLRGVWVLGAVDSSVENIEIRDSGSQGILLHSLQGTENFLISGNTILNSAVSGIFASQSVLAGMDNPGLRIIGNTVDNTGLVMAQASHGIVIQSQDFHIEGNIILNTNWGDGISVSSSGVLIGNIIHSVTSPVGNLGFGIVYSTNHATGASDTLLIQNNTLFSDTIGGTLGGDIRILGFADNEPLGEAGRVHSFVIVGNTLVTTEGAVSRIGVSSDWNLPIDADPIYSFIITANQITDHASAEIEALFDNVHEFSVSNIGGDAGLLEDFSIGFFDQGDSLLFTDVIDFNQDTFISLADINEETTVTDTGDPGGALGDVIIQFAGGGSVTIGGIGNGTFTSIDDILNAGYDIGLG